MNEFSWKIDTKNKWIRFKIQVNVFKTQNFFVHPVFIGRQFLFQLALIFFFAMLFLIEWIPDYFHFLTKRKSRIFRPNSSINTRHGFTLKRASKRKTNKMHLSIELNVDACVYIYMCVCNGGSKNFKSPNTEFLVLSKGIDTVWNESLVFFKKIKKSNYFW